ncbi:hypothetical protein B0A48_00634 [Cryoendolithus antarcticus]|uniref:SCP domain-containing protein n=1 Tax=Cryoendolithus antarcticus TaxID=1507870 RepID=A0A1V8TVE6_9PEZI|nr:hypothetical protein B0A48_00634 [Cryoendolithus antarcticus]
MATPDAEQQEALDLHNEARAEVGSNPLRWHVNCANAAAVYAQELANKDTGLEHATQPDDDSAQGENLASSGSEPGNQLLLATQLWYDEKPNWDGGPLLGNKSGAQADGHYTQMIWSSTDSFGIASATAASGKVYTVGRYYPAGNMIGSKPAEKVASPTAPSHPQAGGGGTGGTNGRPGGNGGGQMGGGPGVPNRPGGFGGGPTGGMPGMPGMAPVMMPGMMPGTMTGMMPGMMPVLPWTAPALPPGMPRSISHPYLVGRRVAMYGMPPLGHPDFPMVLDMVVRGMVPGIRPFRPPPGMPPWMPPPVAMRRPPPGWRPHHRPSIWTPFGWR